MSFILVCSIAIRVIAFGWSVFLLIRVRDWRVAFLTGMILLMALRQTLTLVKAPQYWPLSFSANIDELPGLVVSILALLALLFLERMIREHSKRSAELESANQRLVTEISERKRAEEALRESETQLDEAIEAMSEGFTYFDAEDRLIRCNTKHRELFPSHAEFMVPGVKFEDLLRKQVENIDLPWAVGREEEWISERIEEHRNPGQPREQEFADGRVIRLSEYKTKSGGVVSIRSDITELKETEKALRESRDQLRLITDNLPVAIAYIDTDKRFRFVNRTLAEWYARPAEEILGKSYWEALGELASPAAKSRMEAALAGSRQYGERVSSYPDGKTRTIEVSYAPDIDDSGTVRGCVAFNQDITERKQAEAALRESESRLVEAQRIARVGNWDLDLKTGELYWSDEIFRMFHIEREAFDGTTASFYRRIHPDDREHVRQVSDAAIIDGETYSLEHRIVLPDGEERIVHEQAEVDFDESGEPVSLRGTVQDITERKRAEHELRESEELFSRAFHASPGLFAISRPKDGAHYDVNRTWIETTGYSREEAMAHSALELGIWMDTKQRESFVERLEKEGSVRDFEAKFRTKDGRELDVLVAGEYMDIHGDPRMLVVSHDITERKQAEEQLRQAQKMEAIGRLTAGVAHDFNNMLAVTLGNAELLEDKLGKDDPQLAAVVHATQRGAELTQHLLAFSRKQVLNPKVINANDLIAGITGLLRHTLEEHIDIETVAGAGLWNCEVDPARLENALVNLAINARDAMPDGGKLTIETANARLDDDYAAAQAEVKPGQYVMLAVTDTGTGMAPEVRDHAFEPFFSTKAVGKGTGLGLAMVYGFVKQSGGHVTIYSEPGEGTTIKLYLPRSTAAAAAEPEAARDAVPLSRGETVLVVEDDPDLRTLAVALLSGLGYQVMEAGTAAAALEQLASTTRVNLLLTDVVLPGGMNGRELAEAAARRAPGLQVLYMSGYTENAIVHHGRLDADAELLQKPFRRADLARAVRRALDRPPA
jgi:PAS domain S-box-containing protein